MQTIGAVFGRIADSLSEKIKNAFVQYCRVNKESRTVLLGCTFNEYLTLLEKESFVNLLKTTYNLNKVVLTISFENVNLNESIVKEEAEALRRENAIINGYFNDADFSVNQNEVYITLKYGGKETLEKLKFQELFINKIKKDFGKDVVLTITFTEPKTPEIKEPVIEAVTEALIEAPIVEETPLPTEPEPEATPNKNTFKTGKARHRATKFTSGEMRLEGDTDCKIYTDSAEVKYGKPFAGKITNMIDVSGDGEEYIVWGEVFENEFRTTKRGDKSIVNFKFSDKTNSLLAKMFVPIEDVQTLQGVLKSGKSVAACGTYKFDEWSKDFILDVSDIAAVKQLPGIMDDMDEKRVELHCHTNMSAKDAMASGDKLVNLAYEWGHKAIAITDHGVVQAFPAVAGAVKGIRKKGGDFKVIYGVEAYFVNDERDGTDFATLYKQGKVYHQIILAKNLVGLKNLYILVSKAHLDSFYKRPVTLKSELDKHREGLIIGSACEQGELYDSIIRKKTHEEQLEIAKYYDYLEIQPLGNNEFMLREAKVEKVDKKTGQVKENIYKDIHSFEDIKNFNRQVVALGDELGKPVVATGDVHFLRKEDEIIRKIVMAGQGYDDFDLQAPLYLKTTKEMLSDFEYFGDRAREFVIDNPNKIADMCDASVQPVPDGNYPPVIEGSDQLLRDICWEKAHSMYGNPVPKLVEKRLNKELDAIIGNGFSIMYVTAQKLVAYSEEHGYLVGSRGSVGSSFVATMAGISEVNPLAPHYYCPKCQYSEFYTHGEYGSGFDMPEKNCPHCGTALKRDGHDIPFETFLGFKGDKVPDIDLNFSDEFQNEVQKYTETLFGRENVFKAGTISTIAEKTAFGFVKAYIEKTGISLSRAEMERLAKKVEKSEIKQTTGQHPAGMVVVPRDKTIYDFCPIQHPADDTESDIITTHFDFHSIHDTILKLDELGHLVPTMYKYLEEYTGIPVNDISMSDEKVYSLFTSTDAIGVTAEEIDSKTGTYCLPEFGTKFVREMLVDCKPKNFADLLQISGLSHGTDVYLGNAKDLIDQGICTISEVIGTRDNIMVKLIQWGMDEGRAFKITETVRKGLVSKGAVPKEDWESMKADMRAVGAPEWYINSCEKIKYMFPKAHAAAYVISALRVAWYKVYSPIEFYCAYFTARPEDVDVKIVCSGHDAVKGYISEIKSKGNEATKKELDVYNNMLIFNEMMARGLEILPVDLKKSHANKYLVEDGKMRLPFCALPGVGDRAAVSLYEAATSGNFLSIDELQTQAGVSKTVMETLKSIGALKGLPETNQMTLF